MHFAFTDQQTEFRDAVRQVLMKECTADDLRSAYAAPAARTRSGSSARRIDSSAASGTSTRTRRALAQVCRA